MEMTKSASNEEINNELELAPIDSTFIKEISNELELAPIDSTSNTEICNEKESAPIEPPTVTYASLSKSDKILFNVAFTTGGISGFIMWNCILNSGVSRQNHLWPGETFTSLLGAAEGATAILTTVVMYWFNGLSIKLIYAGGSMSLLSTVLFPTICVVYAGMENLKTARALLICLCLIDGVASGIFSVVSLSFASIVPFSHVIPLGSCGIGIAGITAFSSYLILSNCVFAQTLEGQKPLLFTFFSIATFLILVQLTTFTLLFRRPWFNDLVKRALPNSEESWNCSNLCSTPFNAVRKKFRPVKNAKLEREVTPSLIDEVLPEDSKEPLKDAAPIYKPGSMDKNDALATYKTGSIDNHDALSPCTLCSTDLSAKDRIPSSDNIDINDDKMDKSYPPPRHIKLILKDSWPQLLIGSISTAITASTFPYPGPESWGKGDTWQTIFIGTFQVFNMIMRFTPAWAPLRIPFKWFWPVVLTRLGFIPLFLTPGRWGKGNAFWSHPATLVTLLFVFTAINGWAITLASMYIIGAVENPKEKPIISKILIIFFSAALTVGFSAAYLLTL